MKLKIFCILSFLLICSNSKALEDIPKILSMEERAQLRDQWLGVRLETIVPELMRRENIDMWIIIGREYSEGPVIKTMLPANWFAARRCTILVFFDRGEEEGLERLAVARYDIGDFFKKAWDKEKQSDQWQCLAEIVEERNPRRIALNTSSTFSLADGMTKTEYDDFIRVIPRKYAKRVVSGERLAIGWLETRSPQEMEVYPAICRIAHRIIAEGLSDRVIQPGFTCTEDVAWWYRERIRELKLVTWFHPSVSVQRAGNPEGAKPFPPSSEPQIIQAGDLIHIDFGITYLGLNTDTQQLAYVFRPGETDAPKGLRDGLALGNRLQDILTSHFNQGWSGNKILSESLKQARSEGIVPFIYTHPLGYHGHAAGPTIGLWDQQDGVPGKGDYELFFNTAYAIELSATVSIPEWDNKEVQIMLEEDAVFTEQGVRYIDGRQTELILIP